jgi:hypothetical protein
MLSCLAVPSGLMSFGYFRMIIEAAEWQRTLTESRAAAAATPNQATTSPYFSLSGTKPMLATLQSLFMA